MTGEAKTSTARENFHNRLERWIHFSSEDEAEPLARLDLTQACGAIHNDKGKVPALYHHDIRDAIGNCIDADQWEQNGRTYAGAAQRILASLKAMTT